MRDASQNRRRRGAKTPSDGRRQISDQGQDAGRARARSRSAWEPDGKVRAASLIRSSVLYRRRIAGPPGAGDRHSECANPSPAGGAETAVAIAAGVMLRTGAITGNIKS